MGVVATLRAGLAPYSQSRDLVRLVESMGPDPVERLETDYRSLVRGAYKGNGIVFAAIMARFMLFSQARLRLEHVRTGDRKDLPPRLAGTVQVPWPNGSESEMLARIEQDTSLAGNWYLNRAVPGRWQRLRPDWVDIVLDPRGAEVVGYLYHPGGRFSGHVPVPLLPEDVAHGSPIPDPAAAFRGMSWLTPVVREVMADEAMTRHKLKFFEQGASPNLLIRFMETLSQANRDRLEARLTAQHAGWRNAHKTLVLEAGGDATIIGANMQQAALDTVQAAGENRIAVAAGVPSIVLGIKEGAEQATYSNYGHALTHFANFTIQHLWDHTAGTLHGFVPVPAGWRLVYETAHIPALQADQKQEAEIAEIRAVTIQTLVDSGFTRGSAVEAVATGDVSVLVEDESVTPDSLDVASEPPEPNDDEGSALLRLLAH